MTGYRSAIASAAILGLIAGGALAADNTGSRGASTATGSAAAGQSGQGQFKLMQAVDLHGDQVRSSDGQTVGQIDHLLIDMNTGIVSAMLVSSQGNQSQLTVIPWKSAKISGSNTVEVPFTADKIKSSPPMSVQSLAEMTSGDIHAQVTSYFAPAGTSGQQGKSTAQSQGQGQSGQSQQAQSGGTPMLMVGRSEVVTIEPPPLSTAKGLKQAAVQSSDGKMIGAINKVVLDQMHDRVAYLEVGGGQGSTVRVPFEALSWAPTSRLYVLNMPSSKIASMQGGAQQQGTGQQTAAEMQSLYQDFGVKPYWQ